MDEYVVKRRIQHPLVLGLVAALICFAATLIYWPIWGSLAKAVITAIAGEGLLTADAKTQAKFIQVFAEATFFWLSINVWIWMSLIFANFGKYRVTNRQPGAGLYYVLVSLAVGAGSFLIFMGIMGLWWPPFSFDVLFTPNSPEQVHMAIEGWEASNFYALAVIFAQIPFAAVLQKWPFAGKIEAPWDGVGVMAMSTVAALFFWFATVVPSLMGLTIGEHPAVLKPMGSWATFVAFCQSFIWMILIPAEGGEGYPQKFFAKKQPWAGLVGIGLALAGGFLIPMALRPIFTALGLGKGLPIDLVVASMMLTVIIFTLMWHHIFDDYPSEKIVPNQAARILIRIATWLVLGFGFGALWVSYYKLVPFGANDMGLGYPTMGVLAGQFAFLMAFVFLNTFFDKWPLITKVPKAAVAAK